MAKQFDYQVHQWSKEGKVIKANPYRLVIDSEGKRFERPPLSGMWYAEDGTLLKERSALAAAKIEADDKARAEQTAKVAQSERDAFKAEIRAEVIAEMQEKKESHRGSGSKA